MFMLCQKVERPGETPRECPRQDSNLRVPGHRAEGCRGQING